MDDLGQKAYVLYNSILIYLLVETVVDKVNFVCPHGYRMLLLRCWEGSSTIFKCNNQKGTITYFLSKHACDLKGKVQIVVFPQCLLLLSFFSVGGDAFRRCWHNKLDYWDAFCSCEHASPMGVWWCGESAKTIKSGMGIGCDFSNYNDENPSKMTTILQHPNSDQYLTCMFALRLQYFSTYVFYIIYVIHTPAKYFIKQKIHSLELFIKIRTYIVRWT